MKQIWPLPLSGPHDGRKWFVPKAPSYFHDWVVWELEALNQYFSLGGPGRKVVLREPRQGRGQQLKLALFARELDWKPACISNTLRSSQIQLDAKLFPSETQGIILSLEVENHDSTHTWVTQYKCRRILQ